jgi:protein subunit release factor A
MHRLPAVLEGDLDEILDALSAEDQRRKLGAAP